MQCPICKQELVIKNKKVGETESGEAIYNEFAICHDCKKQWNLDKQRAKKDEQAKETKPANETKPAPKKKRPRPDADSAQTDAPKPRKKKRPAAPEAANPVETEKTASTSEHSGRPDTETAPRPKKKKRPAAAPASAETAVSREDAPRPKKKKRPVTPEAAETANETSEVRPRPKKRRPRPDVDEAATRIIDEPFEDFSDLSDDTYVEHSKPRKRRPIDNTQPEQTYSNIPPKHVRESREREMRENYQNMLDEGEDEEERRFPIVLVVILILLVLAAAAFAGYWFLLR